MEKTGFSETESRFFLFYIFIDEEDHGRNESSSVLRDIKRRVF